MPFDSKSRFQGLVTLVAVSASRSLGSIFRPPTLLGFALQSFSPLPSAAKKISSFVNPLMRFLHVPFSTYPALQRVHQRGSRYLFCTRIRRTKNPYSPEPFGLLGVLPVEPGRRHLHFFQSFSLLSFHHLTAAIRTSLKVFSSNRSTSPYC